MKQILFSILFIFMASISYAQADQGCSTQTLCYNQTKQTPVTAQFITKNASSSGQAEMLLTQHNPFIVILSFLGLGLLLAFTPCILPMVPILYGIIVGHHKKNLSLIRAFSLSLAYVLGMAIAYAIAGIIAALIGNHIQTELQKPWVIVLFSGIFVLMALSLFGLYEFQLPARWQKKIVQTSNKQKNGTYLGVFLMGGISSLIVSPCISPALVGVLAYVAHTGDIWLGAVALLSLGIGMGLPLLLAGTSLAKLLPKTGAWMKTIEHLVGILMLGVAIWLLARIISGPPILFLWSALFIISAIIMGDFAKALTNWQHVRHGLATLALTYGIILLIGAFLGNSNPLYPWENWHGTPQEALKTNQPLFTTISNMAQFNKILDEAKQEKKWVLLDFYADWCEICVRMDRTLFKKQKVKEALSDFILLRANITDDNAFDETLMDRFKVTAPPTLLFFTPDGQELTDERFIGETTGDELITQIKDLKENSRDHSQ